MRTPAFVATSGNRRHRLIGQYLEGPDLARKKMRPRELEAELAKIARTTRFR